MTGAVTEVIDMQHVVPPSLWPPPGLMEVLCIRKHPACHL